MRRALLLGVVLALAGASPAAAGDVKVTAVLLPGDRSGDNSYAYVEWHGAPGERNTVTVTGGPDTLVVRDASAPLTAGSGCRAIDAHAAECRNAYPRLTSARLRGEDGDDVLNEAARRISGELFGGSGDDVLAGDDWQRHDGGEGADRLIGSARADSLQGGAGTDEVHAGNGMDRVVGDPAGVQGWRDVLDGGAADDTVSYEGRTTGVTIDLAVSGPQGAPGEGDLISGFESATGGEANDVLRGTEAPDVLAGAGGDNVLIGLGGRDQLLGSDGNDRLDGGPGADRLEGVHGSDVYVGGSGDDRLILLLSWYWEFGDDDRAAVSCGPGRDVAEDPDEHTLVPRDCEVVWFEPVTLRVIRAGPQRLVLGLDKVRTEARRMTVYVTRREGGRTLARRVMPLGRRAPRRIGLRWRRRAGGRVLVRLRGREPSDTSPVEPLGAFNVPISGAHRGSAAGGWYQSGIMAEPWP